MTSHQVEVAAESFVASLLSRAGYDVSVRYGANQARYDLVAIKEPRILQVNVKGSTDGGWVLTASKKEGRTYHEAAEVWLEKHGPALVCAFVQFLGTSIRETPRVYVARASEVATYLKSLKKGHGDTRFDEKHTYQAGKAKGHTDQIPPAWLFSQERIDTV